MSVNEKRAMGTSLRELSRTSRDDELPCKDTVQKCRMCERSLSWFSLPSSEGSSRLHVQEYIALDMHGALKDAGFTATAQKENTPGHRTVVAVKAA